MNAPSDLENHVVLIGYGCVGRVIGEDRHKAGQRFIVIERSRDIVDRRGKHGIPVIPATPRSPI